MRRKFQSGWRVLTSLVMFYCVGLLLIGGSINRLEASHCTTFTAGGYFFDSFESVEYINNLLVLHFKLKTPFNDGRQSDAFINFRNDECQNGHIGRFSSRISITPGVQYYSIRFSSPTHFDVWNDETNTKEPCSGCSVDLASFPGYYEVVFAGTIDGGASTFHSTSNRVNQPSAGPPIRNSRLPTPPNCREFSASGYFFDNYERSEYLNGNLVYYFRFNSPYNDGRSWTSSISFYDEACNIVYSQTLPSLSTQITPFTRYFSIRFSTPTHFDVWNDETNTKESCPSCSVDIQQILPNGSQYRHISFNGLMDGGASTLTSTPHSPLDITHDTIGFISGTISTSSGTTILAQ